MATKQIVEEQTEDARKDRYQLILLQKVLSGVAYDLAIKEAKEEACLT